MASAAAIPVTTGDVTVTSSTPATTTATVATALKGLG